MESVNKTEQNGVSTTKSPVRNAIQDLDQGLFPKAFCRIVPDVFGEFSKHLFSKPTANVMHSESVGAKAVLAYLYGKETGDLNVWKGIAQDAIVMNLDDMLCSGITNNILLSSTIRYNSAYLPESVAAAIIHGIAEYLEHLRSQHIGIFLGERQLTACDDWVQTVLIDSTVAARIRQNEIIANDRIQDGDVIIGLSSYGKATYETSYNSGIGNAKCGLLRQILSSDYAENYAETLSCKPNSTYTGSKKLTDASPVEGMNIGQLLLSPMRTYLPLMKAVLENYRPSIHGLVHCTHGGQTKCMDFVDDLHVIKDHLFEIPPVFAMIQNETKNNWQDMYKIFNMGHGLEIFTKEKIADDIIKLAKYFGIDAKIIGHCEASPTKALTIQSEFGTFRY